MKNFNITLNILIKKDLFIMTFYLFKKYILLNLINLLLNGNSK